MKNCREVTRLLSESQERELTLAERTSLKFHLAMCSGCRNFGKHLGTLRKIARSYAHGAADRTEDSDNRDK
ncbi:Putative zinc-finger [Microbulbifer donghaiensis]|uniref:Putative zinc-finger n=1 Tax=Microbulbifer donghaiensis TaxID=494016 RepID=A0A1M4UXT7_9GAMM|nr:zf-HC2 domain-containing protein [Microbulbifer donghaiensis]SHE61457.1 Putative zinc-finger [Microbulbifer donghaiensis]